ncbi:pollen-specific leucine-rich repeat extensin-like protein 1 isoform X11 [Triticum aestivum]|uniref:pollen-specific leucine-rich repeat extensin-like protein 1 isoform X11 n=1 Tax=Triticum aestivum TaxID=4565 RepID=UPI001D0192DB|nr:pollen-specific leucine-rich repeat extensin-like protein 1 isoform X11 [Triticum aestivum]
MKMNRQPSPTPRAHRPPPPVTSPGYLLSLPPPPSQWISPAPRPHLLRCSRRHLAPTYSAAPADASPPPSPQLPPAPGSPCGGCLPSANRPPPASDSSGIAPPPPSGCPRRRSSRHSASSPVGGPSPIRPAVQTHRPRPFTFATPLFSSHREVFSPAPATNTGHCPFCHNGSSTNTSVVVLKPVPHAASAQALLISTGARGSVRRSRARVYFFSYLYCLVVRSQPLPSAGHAPSPHSRSDQAIHCQFHSPFTADSQGRSTT